MTVSNGLFLYCFYSDLKFTGSNTNRGKSSKKQLPYSIRGQVTKYKARVSNLMAMIGVPEGLSTKCCIWFETITHAYRMK